MRLTLVTLTLLGVLAGALSGCGATPSPSPSPAAAGPTIALSTNPDPPTSGDVELIVMVNNAQGQPISDADVYLFVDHTDMQGMGMNGKATPQGNGRYAITAGFEMAGNWKVTVQVKKSPLDVAQDFTLVLQ
jgi:hypothetical protein